MSFCSVAAHPVGVWAKQNAAASRIKNVAAVVNGGQSALALAVRRMGRPAWRDVIAGLVTGLFSIPEGMAYASIGGFNPVAGLYSGMTSTIVGSLFARSVLMVTTLTSALALSLRRSVLKAAGLDPA